MREDTLGQLGIGELVQRLVGNLSSLADRQIELAKLEARQEVKQRGLATATVVGGVTLLFLSLVSLLVAGILALAMVVPGWVAGLIVAVILALIGVIVALIGRGMMTRPVMPRTRKSIEEDIEWAKRLTNSNEK